MARALLCDGVTRAGTAVVLAGDSGSPEQENPMTVKEITKQSEVEAIMQPGGEAALIDFWASWCGPCRAMGPQFEAAAEAMEGEDVSFYKVNTEAHPEISAAFNVRSLPTVVVVHDGQVKDVLVGLRDCLSLKRVAERLVSNADGEGLLSRLFGS